MGSVEIDDIKNKVKEIESIADVRLLVDDFYNKIRKDDLLADIFNEVIKDRWPEHLEKMYCFWQTILLQEHTYYGAPFVPHANLLVSKKHFDRWLFLFHETLDKYFVGENVWKAKRQADKMAEMFLMKIQFMRGEL